MMDTQEVLQFEITGILTRAFLQVGARSHTIHISVAPEGIERIKIIIKSGLNFHKASYRWLFKTGMPNSHLKRSCGIHAEALRWPWH